MMLAQIPGADKAIEAAAKSGGYEAVVLVVVFLGVCFLAYYLVKRNITDGAEREKRITEDATAREKRIMEEAAARETRVMEDAGRREARMVERINHLETYIETVMCDTLTKCTKALVESTQAINSLIQMVGQLGDTLNKRPCFWTTEKQAELISQGAERPKV